MCTKKKTVNYIDKFRRIHPLGTMNINTKFYVSLLHNMSLVKVAIKDFSADDGTE